MTLQDGRLAIVIQAQPTPGQLPTSMTDLIAAGAIATSDGLILGDVSGGVGESGIGYTLDRNFVPVPNVDNGLTRQMGSLLSADVSSLALACPMVGNRADTASTPIATDFQLIPGLEQAFESAGLFGVTNAAPGWKYSPSGGAVPVCMSIWDSGVVYPFVDCLASLNTVWTPNGTGIHTFTWSGKLVEASVALDTFPTTNYGDQLDHPAPQVELAANIFGNTRGWSAMAFNFDNGIQSTPDSNELAGQRIEQTQRLYTLTTTIDIDTANLKFDYDELVQEDATSLSQLTFDIGPANAGSEPASSYVVDVPKLSPTQITPAQPARKRSTQMTADLVNATEGEEVSFLFR